MTYRIAWPVGVALTLLVTGVSTGGAGFTVLGLMLVLVMVFGYVSVRRAAATLKVEARVSEGRVRRGEECELEVRASYRSLMPVGPMTLTLKAGPDLPLCQLKLKDASGRVQRERMPMHASHVGVCTPQVEECRVQDVFGMITMTWKPKVTGASMLVLPQTFQVEELTFAPGDAGLGTMARATEDISSPSDLRAYAPGDAMKKIHWKLSLRKQELLVRRFEEPVLPDALVLMDCAQPKADSEEQEADLRDTLLETAASVMESQQYADRTVRLPIYGSHPTQLEKGMGMNAVLENLARVDFSETDRFERVLTMESRNLSRVGAVVMITANLSGALVEAVTRIRRMGPMVRFYMVTEDPDSERLLRYITRLQHAGVDVAYVLPMRM